MATDRGLPDLLHSRLGPERPLRDDHPRHGVQMSLEKALKAAGLDRYDRQARTQPALLAVFPALATTLVWSPQAASLLGGLATLVVTCGLVFFLAQYARQRGRVIQRDLVTQMGGLPTTIALRHRDTHLPKLARERYHAILRANGQPIPTAAEEAADPAVADDAYRSAVLWLLEQTRGEAHGMILNENIAYGFRRNLLGLKPLALAVIIVCLVISLTLATLMWPSGDPRLVAGWILITGLALGTLAWLFVVTREFVEDASWSYTQRLLAACEGLGRCAA